MTERVLEVKGYPRIRRFKAEHARTVQGECSAAPVEIADGPLVTYADYLARMLALEAERAMLKEAHQRKEEELTRLQAEVDRLTAPVSEKEMQKFALHYLKLGTLNQINDFPVLMITQVQALIAARTAPQQEGEQTEDK